MTRVPSDCNTLPRMNRRSHQAGMAPRDLMSPVHAELVNCTRHSPSAFRLLHKPFFMFAFSRVCSRPPYVSVSKYLISSRTLSHSLRQFLPIHSGSRLQQRTLATMTEPQRTSWRHQANTIQSGSTRIPTRADHNLANSKKMSIQTYALMARASQACP